MLKPNVEVWVWAFVENSFAYRLGDSESFRPTRQHAAAGRKTIKNGVPVLADELRRSAASAERLTGRRCSTSR
jgi:hypothetical protein